MAVHWLPLLLAVLVHGLLLSGADLPCAPRAGAPGQGKVCVCNSSYCDTIERPSRLPRGQYYLYTTSNSTPGFSRATGNFSRISSSIDDDVIAFEVNSSVLFQEILGFGGAFSDSFGIVLNSLPNDVGDKLIDSYFSPTGIEYTMGRVPIGGSDFSPRYYTLDDNPFDENLSLFSLQPEDYNLKIAVIKRAQAVSSRALKLYGCSWFPPMWMKINDFFTASYVWKKYLYAWALYHVKFLEGYRDNGVPIWGVSGGNEIMFSYFLTAKFGSSVMTYMTAPLERWWLKDYLLPLLREHNLTDVKFLALDDQRNFVPYFMNRIGADPEVLDGVAGVAVHWYSDFGTPWTVLDDLHHKYPDKIILYTEASINFYYFGGGIILYGSWDRAEAYIYDIMMNINHFNQGFIDWNLALDTNGGPRLGGGMRLDAAVIVDADAGEFIKQPMFYGQGHFSKFIPPGSRRVLVTSNQNSSQEDVSRSPGVGPTRHTVQGPAATGAPPTFPPPSPTPIKPVVIPAVVLALATSNSDGSHTVMVLNTRNETARVKVSDPEVGALTVELEAKSVNTFVYWY